jgi:DNA-binding MarR family transcriptional regulator
MNEQAKNISMLDRVIHEPARLMIVALLSAIEQADFVYLQHETALNKGTLSSHLARLEEAGYVEITKTFRGKIPQTLLRLTAAGRGAFKQYRQLLKGALTGEDG